MTTSLLRNPTQSTARAEKTTSFYIDIDLPSDIARITVWTSTRGDGMCDTEILSAESEKLLTWQHHEFLNQEEFTRILADFLSQVILMAPQEDLRMEITAGDFHIQGPLNSVLQKDRRYLDESFSDFILGLIFFSNSLERF